MHRTKLPTPTLVALLTASTVLAAASACEKKDPAAEAPKFEPGPRVSKTLAELGGVELTLPDNVTISEAAGEAKATLTAEGLPTITIIHELGQFNGTGTGRSSGGGAVEAEMNTPTAKWTCKASGLSDEQEKLVVSICESLSAPANPNVSKLECKTVTGFDTKPVEAAWAATGDALKACFSAAEGETGTAFGFNLQIEGDSHSFTKYSSPPLADETLTACVTAAYNELQESPAFTPAEGLEAGQIECDGIYSRF